MRHHRWITAAFLSAASLALTLPLEAQSAAAATAADIEEYGEHSTNLRQPPDKVMDALGIGPGMTVGEIGAGRGRYTVHLARRVGPAGKVYANDINASGLEHIRERAQKLGWTRIETVLGSVDDPKLPPDSLDVALMVLTYHHLDRPVDLLKNLIPSLRPGALVAVIDPDETKDPGSRRSEYTSREKIEREARDAGYVLVRVEDFLPRDGFFILKVKD